jgi:hypothetical protein
MDGTLYIAHSDGYDKHFKHHGTYSIQEFKNVSVPMTSVPVTISSTPMDGKYPAPSVTSTDHHQFQLQAPSLITLKH